MSLYQRGRIWYADFYANGKRTQESTGTTTRREAEKFLALRTADIVRGEYAAPVRITLSEFGRQYLDYAKANKRSWLRDEQIMVHLNATFGTIQLADPSSAVAQKISPLAAEMPGYVRDAERRCAPSRTSISPVISR